MKRREFVYWAGLGLMASYLPIALVACSKTDAEAVDGDAPQFLLVGTIAKLQATGYLLDEDLKVPVVKNSDEQLMAVNPTCTHQGCTVEWQQDSGTFACPCHGAKFSPDGKVLAKPAPSPLANYEVKEENGTVLVKIS